MTFEPHIVVDKAILFHEMDDQLLYLGHILQEEQDRVMGVVDSEALEIVVETSDGRLIVITTEIRDKVKKTFAELHLHIGVTVLANLITELNTMLFEKRPMEYIASRISNLTSPVNVNKWKEYIFQELEKSYGE